MKSATIEIICAAARSEFSRSGFAGARLENIARAAGVSKQLIYHYFSSKDELYSHLLELAAHDTLSSLDDDAYETLDPTGTISLFIQQVIDSFVCRPFIAAMTLDAGLHHGQHMSPRSRYLPEVTAFVAKRIAPALTDGAARGEFRPGVDPNLFYWMVYWICSAPFLNTEVMSRGVGIDFSAPEGIDAWRQNTIDFVLHALRPYPTGLATVPTPPLEFSGQKHGDQHTSA